MILFINILLFALFVIIVGTGAGYLTVSIFNKIPAKWLVDYGEEVDEEAFKENKLKFRNTGILLSLLYFVIFTAMLFQYGFTLYLLILFIPCILLVIVGISDKKYMIIPDQLVVAIGITAVFLYALEIFETNMLGATPYFHFTFYSPLLGALIGGGTIFAIGFIGSFLLKKEAMGFGDVKLLAAVGLLFGTYGILIVLILTILTSGFYFIFLMLFKKLKRGDYQPLGPFIVAASVIYICLYDQVNYLIFLYMSQF